MEERIMDKNRPIKVKRDGEEDAEVEFELFDETDEDLIGLSPTELQKELERRERAAQAALAERDKMLGEAEQLVKRGEYDAAEPFYAQALVYDSECERAAEGIWNCRTHNFSKLEPFFEKEYAAELGEADESVREYVLKRAGDRLKAERETLEEEARPLREKVGSAQSVRRDAFLGNRNYYLLRVCILAGGFLLFLVAAAVSAFFIVRTRTNIPVILTASFGGVSLLFALVATVYLRGLVVAQRLVRENEKLSSTDEGARLSEIESRLFCLKQILG